MIAAAFAAAALVSAPAGAGAERPPFALAASPARVVLAPGAFTTVRVTNPGRLPVVVDAATAGFGLGLDGRPRVAAGTAAHWLQLAPRRLVLGAGRGANVTVSAVVPRRAGPGEHDALVLLRTRPHAGAPVPIVMQVGVVVVVKVPGRVVRRLDVRGLRVRRQGMHRAIVLTLWNRGNVSEVVPVQRVRVVLRRGARLVAVLLPPRRQLLPHSLGVVVLRFSGRARGWLRASVVVRRPRPGAVPLRRAFRIRL